MKKSVVFGLIFTAVLAGCSTNVEEKKEEKSTESTEVLSLEQRAKRFIEDKLRINAAEEYHFQMWEANIDTDTLEDAVFVIQREQYAMQKAEKSGSLKNFEAIGYNAQENYLFVYNAGKDEFWAAAPIGANVTQPLQLEFKNILSPAKQDIILDYKLLDGAFRSIYSIANKQVLKVLNYPIYTDLGKETEQAYVSKLMDGSASIAKDVWLYKATLNYNLEDGQKPEEIIPTLEATDELYLRFLFDPKRFKYVTPGFEQ